MGLICIFNDIVTSERTWFNVISDTGLKVYTGEVSIWFCSL